MVWEIQSRHQPRLEPSNQEGNQGNLSWLEGCRGSLRLGQPPADGVRVICPFPVPSLALGLAGVICTLRTLKIAQRGEQRAVRDLEKGLSESPCHPWLCPAESLR